MSCEKSSMSIEKELSGELSSYPASPLIKAGHTVAIINYTRAPKQNLQDMQTQVMTHDVPFSYIVLSAN